MRKLASYIQKYDPILGPGGGERLYRRLQREAAIAPRHREDTEEDPTPRGQGTY